MFDFIQTLNNYPTDNSNLTEEEDYQEPTEVSFKSHTPLKKQQTPVPTFNYTNDSFDEDDESECP